jgi:hypothetical protein
MQLPLGNLQVKELIVHDIPKKLSRRMLREAPDIPKELPVLSQVSSPVNTAIINFFHDRITGTIGSSSAIDVIFDTSSKSPIGTLINDYFTGNEDLRISITQQIANYLFEIQNAANSSGLLLFVRCLLKKDIVLAILKVEREEGVRVKQQILKDGLMTFDVEHIRDLMLTKKTKLFKIILFYLEEHIIKGKLCDQQRSYSDKDVADFFIYTFLGCKMTEEPKILTKKYFETTEKYINERIDSPEQKGAILNHLVSELTNQNKIINLFDFAKRVLPAKQCDDYIHYIQENGLTSGNFTKEISMIENKLKRIQYDFSSGISLLGSLEAISSKAKFTDMENGEMSVEIVDCLKQVKTK